MGATEYNLPQRVLEDITVFAQKYNVDKIILFGSRVKGTNRERSDIDIAVSGGDFDGFYWDIKENAWTLLMFDIIDLSERISEELRQEKMKYIGQGYFDWLQINMDRKRSGYSRGGNSTYYRRSVLLCCFF